MPMTTTHACTLEKPRSRLHALFAVTAATTVLAVASSPALAVEPFTADYQASYMGMQADGKMTLAPAGDRRWRYSINISNALASLSQSPVFEDNTGQCTQTRSTYSPHAPANKADTSPTSQPRK